MMTDERVLAQTIYGEARSGGDVLMTAVANTVINRVAKQSWYGKTITEVCWKGKQYSCWNTDDPNCAIIEKIDTSDPVFFRATVIASEAVAGTLADTTNGATHYYSTYIPEPSWAEGHTPCAALGNMLFYNDIS